MKLHVRHTFPSTVERLWELVLDDAYQDEVDRRANISRELLEERRTRNELIRKVRFTAQRKLPAAIARAVDSDRFSYVQEQRWKLDEHRMVWSVVPDVMADRIRSKGDFRLTQLGPDQVERLVTGEVKATLPLIGERVAKAIVGDIVSGYERTADLTREWLAR
ncbi:MAG: DUF2505 family protein [Myxococcota bacterium]|nr:DUF2505 family protein [Myxococcota bacterium]